MRIKIFMVRLERLDLRTAIGKAKLIGTLTGISGAMLLTFFKGAEIHTGSFHVTLLHPHNGHVNPGHGCRHADVAFIGYGDDVAGFGAGDIAARKPHICGQEFFPQ